MADKAVTEKKEQEYELVSPQYVDDAVSRLTQQFDLRLDQLEKSIPTQAAKEILIDKNGSIIRQEDIIKLTDKLLVTKTKTYEVGKQFLGMSSESRLIAHAARVFAKPLEDTAPKPFVAT